MSDIFEEVNEDVRRDRWIGLWKKYSLYFIGVIVLVVAAVLGNQGWQRYQISQQETAGTTFNLADELFAAGNQAAAQDTLESLALSGGGGVGYLAYMRAAHVILAGVTDPDSVTVDRAADAIALYKKAASIAQTLALRDLALLKAARLVLDVQGPAEAQTALTPLYVSGAPYRLSALELAAVADHALGQTEAMQAKIDMILSEAGAPASMTRRLAILQATL